MPKKKTPLTKEETYKRHQRRKQLSDLYLYTAAGAVKIPYLENDKARDIYDYVLFRLEFPEAFANTHTLSVE